MAVLRYVSDHIEQVIGGLVVLFLLTSILLLIRNINQKEDPAGEKGKSSADDLDIGAIETAMKRVLAAHGVTGGAQAVVAAPSSSSNSLEASVGEGAAAAQLPAAQMAEALKERDTKVQELAREIDRLTSEVSAQKAGGGGAASSDSSGKVTELQNKIEELQARLTEYEIIEDDIADLSLFKEENAQLKQELEKLRSETAAAASAPSFAPAAIPTISQPEPAQSAEDAIAALGIEFPTAAAAAGLPVAPQTESVEEPAKTAATPVSKPASETKQIVPQDEIDALFALAPVEEPPASVIPERPREKVKVIETADTIELSPETESPFDGGLDTEKMLNEVASLPESSDDESVLDADLDTDKLLAEMSSIDADKSVSANSTSKATADAVPAPAAAAAAVPQAGPDLFNPEEEAAGEDDLLAEFKDPSDGGRS